MAVFEIKRHPWGWKVFEAPGVEPFFGTRDQAIGYAETRACFRLGEILVKFEIKWFAPLYAIVHAVPPE